MLLFSQFHTMQVRGTFQSEMQKCEAELQHMLNCQKMTFCIGRRYIFIFQTLFAQTAKKMIKTIKIDKDGDI